MTEKCHEHSKPLADCPFDCVLSAIDGRRVFVWWPVVIHDRSGWYMEGVAWLTTVIKRRRIGHPSYFYNEITVEDQ